MTWDDYTFTEIYISTVVAPIQHQYYCIVIVYYCFLLWCWMNIKVEVEVEPFVGRLKPQSNGPLYSNTVIGRLAVDGWAVTSGTARSGLGGLRPRPVPSSLYQM